MNSYVKYKYVLADLFKALENKIAVKKIIRFNIVFYCYDAEPCYIPSHIFKKLMKYMESLEEIIFACYDQENYDIYKKELNNV